MLKLFLSLLLLQIAALSVYSQEVNLADTNYSENMVSLSSLFANNPMLTLNYNHLNTTKSRLGVLNINLGADLTPITIDSYFIYDFALPEATTNFQFSGGLIVGTGWPLDNFGSGIGMQSNFYDPSVTANVYSQEILKKDYLKFWLGSALLFDLADFIPGEWNHFQLKTCQEIYYRYFLGATDDNNTWIYQNVGDNMKNLRYYANYYAGYKMPFFLKQIGFLFETDIDVKHYSDSTIASGGWGSDFVNMTWGFWQTFSFNKRTTLDFLVQWKNYLQYKPGKGAEVQLWDRKILSPDNYQYLHLHGVKLSLNYMI